MRDKVFFDASVLLYALSRSDTKAKVTFQLLDHGGVVSVQVLNEFANVARKKFRFDWHSIEQILAELRDLLDPPLALTVSIHESGLSIAQRYKYALYDSLLIAAAIESGCTTLYSEDMQHGQQIGALTLTNPFAAKP